MACWVPACAGPTCTRQYGCDLWISVHCNRGGLSLPRRFGEETVVATPEAVNTMSTAIAVFLGLILLATIIGGIFTLGGRD